MPTIKSSTDLINNYNEISKFCHDNFEPVFITKDEKDDLVVMSIKTYRQLLANHDLYDLLKDGVKDIYDKNTRPFLEAMVDIRNKRK